MEYSEEFIFDSTVEDATTEVFETTTAQETTTLAELTATTATVATIEQIDYSGHYETMIALSLIEVALTGAIIGVLIMKTFLERFK